MSLLRHRHGLIASAVLLAQIAVYYGVSRAEVIPPTEAWATFPSQVGDWEVRNERPIDQETLDRLRPDDYLNRWYSGSAAGQSCSLFVAYFKSQRDGRAPHSPQNCLPGEGWASVSNVVRRLRVPGRPDDVRVNEYIVRKDRQELVVHYWYQQNRRVLTNEIVAQFYAIPTLLLHGRTDIALVRIITPVTSSAANAEQTGEQFAVQVFPLICERLR